MTGVKWLSLAAVVALCACGSQLSQTSVGLASSGAGFGRHVGSTPIKHVIVIMQENRRFGFDDLFDRMQQPIPFRPVSASDIY
jgi:phospholipase C